MSSRSFIGRSRPSLQVARKTLCVALGAVFMATLLPPALATENFNEAAARSYSVPAGPLGRVLSSFAASSGIALSFDPKLTEGLNSPGLDGSYTTREGFARLLSGTSLELFRQPDGSYGLRRQLQSSATTLPEVKVVAAADKNDLPAPYAGGQVARGGRLGMLGNTDIMDAPFSLTAFTAQAIEDNQMSTIADVARLDPSVRSTGMAADNSDAFFIRGFALGDNNISEVAFDGLYGAGPNYRMMADYAERIEVLKGPAAMIYGMAPNGAGGGTINVVPKRAGVDLTRIRGSYGNGSQLGTHADVSRRFGDQREFGIRLNGAYQNGDTALDNQSRRASLGAVALDYQGDKLRATLDLIDQREDIDAPSRRPWLGAGIAVPKAPDGQRNVTQAWEYSRSTEQSATMRMEYEATKTLSFFAAAATAKSEVDRLFNTPIMLNSAGDVSVQPAAGTFNVKRDSIEAGVRSRFETAAVSHRVTLQVNRYRDELARATVNGAVYTSNIYHPISQPRQDVALPSDVPKVSATTLTGIALTDTLSAYDERLQLILGLRKQTVESENFAPGVTNPRYDKSALTPAVGLVIKPQKNISLYGNYIEGLAKGDTAPAGADNAGQIFAPYKTKQHEIGVKVDHGSFMTTLSLFQITRPSGQLTNNVYAVDGEQRNRGVELAAYGTPTRGVRLYGGITWIEAKLTQTNTAATQGNTAVGVPRMQGSLNAEWDMPSLSGMTLIASAFHSGKQYVDQANSRELPSWTTVDLGARYLSKIGGMDVVWRANLRNAFDKAYWAGASTWGTLALGAPRTFVVSATVDF